AEGRRGDRGRALQEDRENARPLPGRHELDRVGARPARDDELGASGRERVVAAASREPEVAARAGAAGAVAEAERGAERVGSSAVEEEDVLLAGEVARREVGGRAVVG